MFLLRSVRESDIEGLYYLASQVTFINLPADKEVIEKKIKSSINSFKNPSEDLSRNYYFFVLEDLENNKIVGASMIHAQHGTESEPHFYLKVDQEQKFSSTISTGFIHGTLKLGLESDGPTEIGGLVLDPSYRGNPNKLGKQLSFVRFLYMGLNKSQFKEEVHSELMPPLDKDGNSPLWEAIGRRFTNMDYHDADLLSRNNKEFIINLFPSDTIYQTLLPVEARNSIGKVGEDTTPVKKMLESIGFKYINEVDPFDGGPHYRTRLEDIKPIKNMITGKVLFNKEPSDKIKRMIITLPKKDDGFRAMMVDAYFKDNNLVINSSNDDQIKSLLNGEDQASAIEL